MKALCISFEQCEIVQIQISNERGQAEFKEFWTIKRETMTKEKMSEKKQKYKFWKTRSFPASSISLFSIPLH